MIVVRIYDDSLDILGEMKLKDRGEIENLSSWVHGAMAMQQHLAFKERHPEASKE